jgi:hypothetical protein
VAKATETPSENSRKRGWKTGGLSPETGLVEVALNVHLMELTSCKLAIVRVELL